MRVSHSDMAVESGAHEMSILAGMKPSIYSDAADEPNRRYGNTPGPGALIVNADDWGRTYENTKRTLECIGRGTVSSVSAMVFMEDSERAAAVASEHKIDAGLHLNFTTAFSGSLVSARLREHQERVSKFLGRHRFAQVIFHPGLVTSFEYVVAAQHEEFRRLYGTEPARLDGHHHMHLCSNVLVGRLLPPGTIIRRNFSFQPGEKSFVNRLYRNTGDYLLARRHQVVDFFFSLPPLKPQSRLERILSLAQEFTVEVETHPINVAEYRFLMGKGVSGWTKDSLIVPRFSISKTERKE
jgi:chitin disaccharide deacetylase